MVDPLRNGICYIVRSNGARILMFNPEKEDGKSVRWIVKNAPRLNSGTTLV